MLHPGADCIEFLSTPSARRATILDEFNASTQEISIHALREEGDGSFAQRKCAKCDFYPRPPRGGRPAFTDVIVKRYINFYPRPPRGGRRSRGVRPASKGSDFYPRPPRGGRPHMTSYVNAFRKFLSTPSARRATFLFVDFQLVFCISIHALREEGDILAMLDKIYHTLFLSTPSARRATRCPLCERLRDLRFLSTPSARRATLFRVLGGKPYQNFYPRPPRGGRPRSDRYTTKRPALFLSTPSARRATSCG